MDRFAKTPNAVSRAIAVAIEEPADVDLDETIARPTDQA
jgi:NADP-dependent 3-hydroxy acid dehydrogenase YdfG